MQGVFRNIIDKVFFPSRYPYFPFSQVHLEQDRVPPIHHRADIDIACLGTIVDVKAAARIGVHDEATPLKTPFVAMKPMPLDEIRV